MTGGLKGDLDLDEVGPVGGRSTGGRESGPAARHSRSSHLNEGTQRPHADRHSPLQYVGEWQRTASLAGGRLGPGGAEPIRCWSVTTGSPDSSGGVSVASRTRNAQPSSQRTVIRIAPACFVAASWSGTSNQSPTIQRFAGAALR